VAGQLTICDRAQGSGDVVIGQDGWERKPSPMDGDEKSEGMTHDQMSGHMQTDP